MEPVQKTTSITLDDTTVEVSSLSPQIQQMVAYFDDWRQKETNLTSELLMVRGALRNIQNELLTALQAEKTAANDAEVVVDAESAVEVVAE